MQDVWCPLIWHPSSDLKCNDYQIELHVILHVYVIIHDTKFIYRIYDKLGSTCHWLTKIMEDDVVTPSQFFWRWQSEHLNINKILYVMNLHWVTKNIPQLSQDESIGIVIVFLSQSQKHFISSSGYQI